MSSTLYIRGVPEELVRESKALAARRGITLTDFVIESLRVAVSRRGRARSTQAKSLDSDMRWYEANKARLLARYEGRYLAIVDKRVIDHDPEFSPLATRVFRKLGTRPIFMPRCVAKERVATLRSPRRA